LFNVHYQYQKPYSKTLSVLQPEIILGSFINLYPSWVRSQRPILGHLCINWRGNG